MTKILRAVRRPAVLVPTIAVVLLAGLKLWDEYRLNKAIAGSSLTKIVTDANGAKTLLIPWAIGTPDNIITLRQPLGYTSLWALAGNIQFGAYVDSNAQKLRSESDLAFSALLPDMKPWTPQTLDDFTKAGGGDVVSGLLKTAITEGNPSREKEDLAIRLRLRKESMASHLLAPSIVDISEKTERFGLRRIGPVHLPNNIERFDNLKDLYFIGASPEMSPFFIICDAEEVRSMEDNSQGRIIPHCTHYTTLPELNAVLDFSYRRVFLKDWADIQANVRKLILSFQQ